MRPPALQHYCQAAHRVIVPVPRTSAQRGCGEPDVTQQEGAGLGPGLRLRLRLSLRQPLCPCLVTVMFMAGQLPSRPHLTRK